MRRGGWAIAVASLALAARAPAHHAFAAEFDEDKLIVVSGVVTRLDWINPHAYLYVDGTDNDGKMANWKFEMGSPGGLVSRGWKKDDVHPGDRIVIEGFAAKDGSNLANARYARLPDGRKLFGGFPNTPGSPVK